MDGRALAILGIGFAAGYVYRVTIDLVFRWLDSKERRQ